MSKGKKIALILIIVFLLLAAAVAGGIYYVWNQNVYTASIALQGSQDIVLEVGDSFTDPGATAQVVGSILDKQPQSLTVTSSGTVDTTKLGTYEIVYSTQFTLEHFLGNKQAAAQAKRTVKVVDTQAPTIELTYIDGTFTFPGQVYQEEGFAAADNYDGDLTAQVVREEKDGVVTYTVTDSSGNQTQITREIFYDDPVPPVLTLLGNPQVEMEINQTYQEPGFTAEDNIDGDITANVTVTGSVDNKVVGEYTLTYTVSDAHGNTVTAQRVVQVKERVYPPIPAGVGGVVYLTFDDGPSQHTARLLDILDKYGVKATFFVVGYKDLSMVAEIAARGHAIGNHSYSHNYGTLYASEEAFFAELNACGDKLEAILGYRPNLIRFPGGSSNSVSDVSMKALTQAVQNAGYYYFDWNVDSKDAAGARDADEIFYNVCSGIARRSSVVVLQHDIRGATVDAMERIIVWCLENGYTFSALGPGGPYAHHGTKN